MGLDSPNIQHGIHWRPPPDAELYVQEIGRAGPDGKAILFYNWRHISMSTAQIPDCAVDIF